MTSHKEGYTPYLASTYRVPCLATSSQNSTEILLMATKSPLKFKIVILLKKCYIGIRNDFNGHHQLFDWTRTNQKGNFSQQRDFVSSLYLLKWQPLSHFYSTQFVYVIIIRVDFDTRLKIFYLGLPLAFFLRSDISSCWISVSNDFKRKYLHLPSSMSLPEHLTRESLPLCIFLLYSIHRARSPS